MRKGFGLLVAILIMMTVALLMTMMISYSTSSVKSTIDLYLKEQAEILTRNATEYTLLAISGHNNTQNCIEEINATYPSATAPTHHIHVNVWYIGDGIPVSCSHILENNITTADSNLTAIIDVVVSVDQARTGITEPIRLHRRTIQKP